MVRRERHSLADEWPYLVAGCFAAAWRWRLELGLVLVPVLGFELLADELGPVAATAMVVATGAVALAPTSSRGALGRWLKAARVRRHWRRAWLDVGLPRVAARRILQVPAGRAGAHPLLARILDP